MIVFGPSARAPRSRTANPVSSAVDRRLPCASVITRLSRLFLRTLRDDPADAEVPSHKLLVRAGYVRRVAPGIYSWLPLGLRVLRKVEQVVREEMDAIGAQEISLPALLPRDAYETTNRWTEYGDALFRLKDRKGADYLLGPTHEELFALTVKGNTTPTRICRSRSTRSRTSTAMRNVRARASCVGASSS